MYCLFYNKIILYIHKNNGKNDRNRINKLLSIEYTHMGNASIWRIKGEEERNIKK